MKPINTQKEYQEYVDKKSPNSPIWKNCLNAFWVGGLICTIGQFIMEICKFRGLSQDISSTIVSILLIFLSTLCGNPRCQHSGRSGKWAVLFCSICCKCIKPRRQALNSRAFVCQFRLQRRPCKVRQRIHHRIDLTIFHTCGAICRNIS
mgnify:CR=1 FL=1